jgi:DNA-binding PucR family transcriptional regulator
VTPALDPPGPHPQPLYDAIGRVAAEGARLEGHLAQLLLALLQSPLARYLVAGQSADQLVQQIRALLGTYRDEPASDIGDYLERVKQAMEDRNHIIHSNWLELDLDHVYPDWKDYPEGTPIPDLPLIASRPRRLKLDEQTRTFTVDQLIEIARELERLSDLGFVLAINVGRARMGDEPIDVHKVVMDGSQTQHAWIDDETWVDDEPWHD